MRLPLIAFPLLLAACASPLEQCISSAQRELRTIDRLVNETRGNIARGFAIAEREEVVVRDGTCTGESEDGVEFEFECEKTDVKTVREPVAIDLNAEQAKLASLEERQRQLQETASAQIAQCRAIHPE